MKKTGKFGILVFGLFLILLASIIGFVSFASAGELQVTEEHPFLVNDSWIPAKNLSVGDELLTIDGKKVRITEIEEVVSDETFSVYNLEAKKYSDFVVCGEDECDNDSLGVVVHNSGAKLIAKDIQYQSLGMAIDGTSEVPVILLNGPKKYFKFAGIWDRNAKLGWDDLTLELDSIIRSRFGFNINQPYMIINSNKWVGSTHQINALYHELRHLNLKQGESFSSILSSWDIFRGKKVTLKITPIDGGPETIINVGSNGIVTRIFKGAYSAVLHK